MSNVYKKNGQIHKSVYVNTVTTSWLCPTFL